MSNVEQVKAVLAAVSQDVADEHTVIGSVEVLLKNLADQIAALKAAAEDVSVPQDVVDMISALQTAVDANKTQLAGDVAANTPAAPVAPEAPVA